MTLSRAGWAVPLAAFDFEVGQAAPADLENALYVVFIGGNHIRAARDAFSQGLATRVVHTAVEKVDAAVRHLAARGAGLSWWSMPPTSA